MAKKSKKTKKKVISKKKGKAQSSAEWDSRKPVLKFAGTFLLICLLFYLVTNMEWFAAFRKPLLSMYSGISAGILNIFGYGVASNGSFLTSDQFSVSIEEGCDAIAPAILYAVSVAIFPLAWKYRWRGLLYGLLAIAVLNIIRIISLFITGIHLPALFEFMHVDFWQAIFIVFTVGIWIYWMKRSTEHMASTNSQPAS